MAEDQYVLNWEVRNHSILYSYLPVHNRILPHKYPPQALGDMFHVWSFWLYDSTTNSSSGKNHNLLFRFVYIFLRLSVNFIGKNMASITAGPFRRHSYHLWYIIIAFSRDIEYSITRHNIRSREHWNKGKKEEIH